MKNKTKNKNKNKIAQPVERTRVLTVTLKDCVVQTFRAGGKGGQNQNKVESGVRIIHPPSNARGEARDSRDQPRNKRAAFERMAATKEFQTWVRQQAGEDALMAAQVERELWPDRTIVEVKDDNGNWTKEGTV